MNSYRPAAHRAAAVLLTLAFSGLAAAAVFSEDLDNDTVGQSDPVDPGSDCFGILRGSVSPAADQDHFVFSAAMSERIWVVADTGGAAGAGSTRDTVVTLLGNDAVTVIETDDDDGAGTGGDTTIESGDASVIAGRAAPSPGNYYVRVQGDGAGVTDPYRLLLAITSADTGETETNDSIGAADLPDAVAGCNTAVTGAITSSDVDIFSLALGAGQLLVVAVDGDPARAGGNFDPQVALLDSAGNTLIAVDSSGTSASSPAAESFTYYAPSAGAYYVKIYSAGSTGDYRALIAKSTEPAFADLSAAIADSADPVQPNQAFTYTVSVTNHSPAIAATGVTFDLASTGSTVTAAGGANWSCTLGPVTSCDYGVGLPAGATSPNVTVSVTAAGTTGAIITAATVSGDQDDDAPADNQDGEATIITAAPAAGGGGGGSWNVSLVLLALGALARRISRRRAH